MIFTLFCCGLFSIPNAPELRGKSLDVFYRRAESFAPHVRFAALQRGASN